MKTAALRVPRLAVAIAALSAISAAWAVSYPVDDFPAGATPLTDVTMHNYSGSNASATHQDGEPLAGKTVWWAWKAESTATVYFSTYGSDFDTTLGVYTGTSVASLTRVASNDDYGSTFSRVRFDAVAGTTYNICVSGYDSQP